MVVSRLNRKARSIFTRSPLRRKAKSSSRQPAACNPFASKRAALSCAATAGSVNPPLLCCSVSRVVAGAPPDTSSYFLHFFLKERKQSARRRLRHAKARVLPGSKQSPEQAPGHCGESGEERMPEASFAVSNRKKELMNKRRCVAGGFHLFSFKKEMQFCWNKCHSTTQRYCFCHND
jgi:hypothetical protein